MYEFRMGSGMTRADHHVFLNEAPSLKRHCVMGNDGYQTNEHLPDAGGHGSWAGEVFGYDTVARDDHARYGLPVTHTETNLGEGPRGNEAEHRLWKQWSGIPRLRREGAPVPGVTWYSLPDQIDWTHALRVQRGDANPRGLYDLDRGPRKVGLAYRRLIEAWRDALPTQSWCPQQPLAT